MEKHHADILILGAGMAGYEAYRSLKKQLKKYNIDKKITIIDQNNYFTFTPLLHEVATGAVLPSHASFPIREMTANSPHSFVCAKVEHIDPDKKLVTTNSGNVTYDTCIVALGSISNLYNVPGADEHTYRIRTLSQAIQLNQTVIDKLEEPTREELVINVVGGGYTGVEIAAEFAHLKKEELGALYPHIHVQINIIHATDKLVPHLPDPARKKIEKRLNELGVTIYLNKTASKVTADSLFIGADTVLQNDITVWVTGFTTKAPNYFDSMYIKADRVPVNEYLTISAHPDTYVIGDIALIRDPDNSDIVYPQLGEAAHHEGMYVADHYIATKRKKSINHFHFKSKGQLIPVGEWYGIGVFGKVVLSGRLVWWLRRTVYVLFMPGFIRKLRIVADWTFISKSTRHIVQIK